MGDTEQHGPIIGILGMGGDSSVGLRLSQALLAHQSNNTLRELYLNNKDTPENIEKVNLHIRTNLAQQQGKISRRVRYAPVEEIAETADITFFCYGAGVSKGVAHGVPYWEQDFRKKMFQNNWPATQKLADAFKGKKGQVVVVTNPSYSLAYHFAKEANMEPGQVLAYDPDTQRLREELTEQQKGLPVEIKNQHIRRACIIGNHGTEGIPLIPKFHGQKEYLPTTDKFMEAIQKIAGDLLEKFGSTASEIVPELADFAYRESRKISTDKKTHQAPFFWGVDYKGTFITAPLLNKRNGNYRAEIQTEPINLEEELQKNNGDNDISRLFTNVKKEQEEILTFKTKNSYAAAFDRSSNEVIIARFGQEQKRRVPVSAPLPSLTCSENDLLAAISARGLLRGTRKGFHIHRPGFFSDATISNNLIYAIEDRQKGKTLHVGETEHPLSIPAETLAVNEGNIYLATADGYIYQWTEKESVLIKKMNVTEPRALHVLPNGILALRGTYAGTQALQITSENSSDIRTTTGGSAIAYDRDKNRVLVFTSEGKELQFSTFHGKINVLDRTETSSELIDLAFDTLDNYLYALSPTQLTIIPIGKNRLLTEYADKTTLGKAFSQVKVMRE